MKAASALRQKKKIDSERSQQRAVESTIQSVGDHIVTKSEFMCDVMSFSKTIEILPKEPALEHVIEPKVQTCLKYHDYCWILHRCSQDVCDDLGEGFSSKFMQQFVCQNLDPVVFKIANGKLTQTGALHLRDKQL